MNTLKESVNNLLKEISVTDEITEELLLKDDLGIDSLRLVELIVSFEDEFEIRFEMSDLDPTKIETVADVYALLEKYIIESTSPSLYNFLADSVKNHPDKYIKDENETFTQQDFLKSAEAFAQKLTAPKYAIMCKTELNTAKGILACLYAGRVAIPLSSRYGKAHTDRILKLTNPTHLITDEDGLLDIKKISDETQETEDLSDVALILCTSGTTGTPKGIMLTNDNIISNITGIESYFQVDETDRILIARPLYHCAVLVGELFLSLHRGLDIAFLNSEFNPMLLEKTLRAERTSVLCGTPTLMYHLCRIVQRSDKELPLRAVVTSGECMTEKAAHLIREALPKTDIYNVYGLTEAGPRVSALNPDLFSRYPTSVGRPIEGTEAKIVDGELLVRGRSIMRGYYSAKKETEKALSDGWLHTGDLAEMVDGLIFVKGRKDNLIIKAGMNIYPGEIEATVLKDERISEACAFALKDTDVTQKIVLRVVAKDLNKTEIMKICRQALPSYQQPDIIEVVEKLPRNASGKILRR